MSTIKRAATLTAASVATAAAAATAATVPTAMAQPEAPAANPSPTPQTAQAQSDTPCADNAKACVDLDSGTAWLSDGKGNITYGPVHISSGKPGQETPRGVQTVTRKVKDEYSRQYNGPMPNSVYFGTNGQDNGVALHQGDPGVQSNGCVHLPADASQAFYDHLQPGDIVHVF